MTSPLKTEIVCFCNQISKTDIEQTLKDHPCSKLKDFYLHNTAGLGACGGSCRPLLLKMIKTQNSEAPESQTIDSTRKYDDILKEPIFLKSLSLFNRHYFWETHEALEDLWLQCTDTDLKLFYQCLIQAAAAFYHALNENPKGCLKMSELALQKLEKFNKDDFPINLQDLEQGLVSFVQQSKEILGRTLMGFQFDHFPKLSFCEKP